MNRRETLERYLDFALRAFNNGHMHNYEVWKARAAKIERELDLEMKGN